MKRFENFTESDLSDLRKEIVVNSIYLHDYDNSFGISAESVATFFDGYYDYLWELAEEKNGKSVTHSDVMLLDNAVNLLMWYNCFDNFDWVTYVY